MESCGREEVILLPMGNIILSRQLQLVNDGPLNQRQSRSFSPLLLIFLFLFFFLFHLSISSLLIIILLLFVFLLLLFLLLLFSFFFSLFPSFFSLSPPSPTPPFPGLRRFIQTPSFIAILWTTSK